MTPIRLQTVHVYLWTLQVSNGLVWPIRVLGLVQRGLWECGIQILNGHLLKGNHVFELLQLDVCVFMRVGGKKTKTES